MIAGCINEFASNPLATHLGFDHGVFDIHGPVHQGVGQIAYLCSIQYRREPECFCIMGYSQSIHESDSVQILINVLYRGMFLKQNRFIPLFFKALDCPLGAVGGKPLNHISRWGERVGSWLSQDIALAF